MSLIIENLKKSFGSKVLFDGFSYKFDSTGLYAICGESGSGKTTLLRMISGLDKDYLGKIEATGVSAVSYCFQEHRLFSHLTALDNIIVASFQNKNENTTNKAKDFLKRLKFSDKEMNLKPSSLSGGMKQRVSIARAILRDAPILLLDEPTKELDPRLIDIIHSVIKEEAMKRLIIIVSHSPAELDALSAIKINISEAAEQ